MTNTTIKLYRKRIVPDELILLDKDHIIWSDNSRIITSWNTLKPRSDFSYGYSAYFIDDGIKISKIFTADGSFLYYYCDIISTAYDPSDNSYVFTDLLADVIIMPDGFVKVVDLDELSSSLDNGTITPELVSESLKKTNLLLNTIYSGQFHIYTDILDKKIADNTK